MARLIDADVLGAGVKHWKRQQHSMNIDYSTGYRCALSTVEGMIADAPAVDAIPVEWLRNLCAIAKMETDDEMFIDWLIQTWQEEQEAKEG